MASDQSAGRSYVEAVGSRWKLSTAIPAPVAKLRVGTRRAAPIAHPLLRARRDGGWGSRGALREAGAPGLLERAEPPDEPGRAARDPRGEPRPHRDARPAALRRPRGIVTNPNCSAIVIAMALAPLHRAFGIDAAIVTTFQATSGAGYPGVPSLDILGNVIPFVSGGRGQDRVRDPQDPRTSRAKGIAPAEFPLSALCHRVPVIDGHLIAMSVRFSRRARRRRSSKRGGPSAAPEARTAHRPGGSHRGTHEDDRPQPRLDADRAGGMGVTVGRLRRCPVLEWKFEALGHNTIRGAAGAAILNAEILARDGRL